LKRLFLNSERIENIDHLREVFKTAQNKDSLFGELWLKFLSGNLSNWLKLQEIDEGDIECSRAISSKKEVDDLNLQPYGDLLCSLCGIEATYEMRKMINTKHQVPEGALLKLEQLQMTKWYNKDLFKDDMDWDRVVTSQEELDDAISSIGETYFKKAGTTGEGFQYTLYLCNMGHPYTIDFKFSNIKFLGFGQPRIRIDLPRSLRIVLEDYHISFENVVLESKNEVYLATNKSKCKGLTLLDNVHEI
jgi:hypothetical protein